MNIVDIHSHALHAGAIVNCYPDSFRPQQGYCYSVGIHPWHIHTADTDAQKDLLRTATANPQVVAIGEAGLDKLATGFADGQEDIFRFQCILAEEMQKPLIVHLVRAVDELLRMRSAIKPTVPWVIHGFRGGPQLAEELLRHGMYISFGTRYNATAMRTVPRNRMFLETDDSNADIRSLYEEAASVIGISEEELRDSLRRNIRDIFFKGKNTGSSVGDLKTKYKPSTD